MHPLGLMHFTVWTLVFTCCRHTVLRVLNMFLDCRTLKSDEYDFIFDWTTDAEIYEKRAAYFRKKRKEILDGKAYGTVQSDMWTPNTKEDVYKPPDDNFATIAKLLGARK